MSALRQLGNFWIPWVTTIVLACFSHAFSQASYQVIDLGVLHNGDNAVCAMGVNNHGWTEIMDGNNTGGSAGKLLNGRAVVDIDGLKIDLGTLGGGNENSWISWDGINDRGVAVGFSETAVPDPNGEDVCGFGTGLTCRPFVWQNGHMSALPTVGGNNGQAGAINQRGQIVGYAENGIVDSTCPPGVRNNRIDLPVLWEKGKAITLPTVGNDPDGIAYGINNQGQAVGYSGTCTLPNAVLWENGSATQLPDLGVPGSVAFASNDQGQIVGQVVSADGTTAYAALWQNGAITSLGTLPGDFGSYASGISNQGLVLGTTYDSSGNFNGAFLWQNGVMTDFNTLFPASSNLYATMLNTINERGQISGMATVLSGPHVGDTHPFLATPVNANVGKSAADVARTLPKITLPANVSKQLLPRLRLGRFQR